MRKVGEEVQIALLERRKMIEIYDTFRKRNPCLDRRKWSHFVKYVMDTNGH